MCEIELGKNKNIQKGFSLIELIIILLVIAILVTLALPSIQGTMRLYRLETSAGFILHRLTEARLVAIKRNRDAWLEIDSTNRILTIKSTNDAGQQIILGHPTHLPGGIRFIGSVPDSVIFTSLGRNRVNGNTQIKLKLEGGSGNKTINVGATGNVTTTK